jgi:hypothetical protein
MNLLGNSFFDPAHLIFKDTMLQTFYPSGYFGHKIIKFESIIPKTGMFIYTKGFNYN